ncbi:MAG TPA: POTRA domain-containing protein [Allosphingosinicella sp.]|nr:POTRA domain-containing protein [Allosphingosinicella sp.]
MNGTVVAVLTVLAAPVAAQTLPPADVLRRTPTANPDRINEEQRQRLQERAVPENPPPRQPQVEAPPPADASASGEPETRFTLTSIEFEPSNYLAASELDAFAKPLIGTEVSLGDLQRLVDRINALYAQKGLTTARAALPAQQIEGGVVRVALIEGRVGTIGVEGGSAPTRRQAERQAAPPKGSLAAPRALEDRLRLFNANNDAQARARLAPGTEYGTTDVTLTLAEPARYSGDLFIDNNGFESTGALEVGAVLRAYRVFSDADRLSAVIVASRGVVSSSLSLSTPIGDRFRVGASGSYGRTRVLFGPLASLGITGTSLSFGGDAAALVLINTKASVTATASIQTTLSRTEIAGERVVENDAVNASAGALATYAVPGLSATLQAQVTRAHVRERLSDETVKPLLLQGSAALAKVLGKDLQGRLRGDWQLATRDNLPGILQYQIGGTRSARSLTPGAGAGDSGFSTAAELAYATVLDGVAIEPYAFVDHAQASLPGQRLSAESAGVGLNLSFGAKVFLRGTLATTIRHSAGLEGSTRGYISATARF